MIDFFIYLFFPLVLGFISTIFTDNSLYNMVNTPLDIPSIVFPIVWTILYLLMGLSSYFNKDDKKALKYYLVQLIVNIIWPIIFFDLKWYLVSSVWIVLLIILVIRMIRRFYENSKLSAYLNIPYLLWLLFALYLNFSIYLMN